MAKPTSDSSTTPTRERSIGTWAIVIGFTALASLLFANPCPTGSRKFGNVLDPESEVAYILKHKRVFVLKEDVGTLPRFFYYFDERGSRYHEAVDVNDAGGPA